MCNSMIFIKEENKLNQNGVKDTPFQDKEW